MRIAIAGGHGRIAMLLHPLLIEREHAVSGLVRNPDHAAELRAIGVDPVVCDLETADDLPAALGAAG